MKEYIERAHLLKILGMMIAMSWLQEGVGTLYLLPPPLTLRR